MATTGAAPTSYEVSVHGSLGPVLRTALGVDRVTTITACTVIRLREARAAGLVEVLDACEALGLEVREVHLVSEPG